MSNSPKIPRGEADAIARKIAAALGPHCEVFKFAGSLRRRCAMIGDIEAVVLPKMMEVSDGLFGKKMVRDRDFVLSVMALGHHLSGDPVDGRHVKINFGGKRLPAAMGAKETCEGGIQLDLFIPQPCDYGRQLAIRTGPDQTWSRGVLARRWVAMGWVGVKDLGLRRAGQCTNHAKEGAKPDWRLNAGLSSVMMPPEFPTEESFFEFLGLEYVKPENRF